MQLELIPTKQIKLRLTTQQAYARKQRLWRLYCEWAQRIRRAFAPETGGVSLYLHNWYRCSSDPAKAKLGDWIEESTMARYRRLKERMEARSVEREHLHHCQQMIEELVRVNGKWQSHMRPFDALWCPLCPTSRSKIVQPFTHR